MTDTDRNALDALRALQLLDLTELGDNATDDDVRALCERAVTDHGQAAAVCVWPRAVTTAVYALAGTGVRIATVVNFPSGDEPVADVVAMTEQALLDGADEIDLVLPYRAVLEGEVDDAAAMVKAVRQAVPRDGSHLLKVILETGELDSPATVETAARLAIGCGADFIKTSTGKTANSASLEATAVMLGVIHQLDTHVGLKPSGGIRTLADAQAYLAQADEVMGPEWASPRTFRFGASGLLTALVAVLDGSHHIHDEGSTY